MLMSGITGAHFINVHDAADILNYVCSSLRILSVTCNLLFFSPLRTVRTMYDDDYVCTITYTCTVCMILILTTTRSQQQAGWKCLCPGVHVRMNAYAEMDDSPKTQRFQLHVLDGWCGGIIIASLQQTQTTLIAAVKWCKIRCHQQWLHCVSMTNTTLCTKQSRCLLDCRMPSMNSWRVILPSWSRSCLRKKSITRDLLSFIQRM